MSKSKTAGLTKLIVLVVFSLALGSEADALDLYADNVPQAQFDTCQSYSVIFALAAKSDPALSFETFADIRKGEAAFRTIAAGMPGGPFGHDALKSAVTSYTSDRYRLEVEYLNGDIVAWMQRAKALTTVGDSGDALIGKLTGQRFPTVLTSVTKLGDSLYNGGHIITVLGIVGSGFNSSTQISAFNSAIKGEDGSVNRCQPGNQPGDTRYKAGVVTTEKFELKQFPKGNALMHIEKN